MTGMFDVFDRPFFIGVLLPGYVAVIAYLALYQPDILLGAAALPSEIFSAVVLLVAGPAVGLTLQQLHRTPFQIQRYWKDRRSRKTKGLQEAYRKHAATKLSLTDSQRDELSTYEAYYDFMASTTVVLAFLWIYDVCVAKKLTAVVLGFLLLLIIYLCTGTWFQLHLVRQMYASLEETQEQPKSDAGSAAGAGAEARVEGTMSGNVETEPRMKARALVTAEAIIAGFLFANAAIQHQALQSLWTAARFPVANFGVLLINYALIVLTFRCIWLALRAVDMDRPKLYQASYTMFISVLVLAIFLIIAPNVISIFKASLYRTSENVSLPCEEEYRAAWVCGSTAVVFGLVVIASLWPEDIVKCIRWAWNRKLLVLALFVAILAIMAYALSGLCPSYVTEFFR